MSSGVLAALALFPILLAGILLIGLRWPAHRAMPLVFLVTAAIGLYPARPDHYPGPALDHFWRDSAAQHP